MYSQRQLPVLAFDDRPSLAVGMGPASKAPPLNNSTSGLLMQRVRNLYYPHIPTAAQEGVRLDSARAAQTRYQQSVQTPSASYAYSSMAWNAYAMRLAYHIVELFEPSGIYMFQRLESDAFRASPRGEADLLFHILFRSRMLSVPKIASTQDQWRALCSGTSGIEAPSLYYEGRAHNRKWSVYGDSALRIYGTGSTRTYTSIPRVMKHKLWYENTKNEPTMIDFHQPGLTFRGLWEQLRTLPAGLEKCGVVIYMGGSFESGANGANFPAVDYEFASNCARHLAARFTHVFIAVVGDHTTWQLSPSWNTHRDVFNQMFLDHGHMSVDLNESFSMTEKMPSNPWHNPSTDAHK